MKQTADDKYLYGGLIRLHILHLASQGPFLVRVLWRDWEGEDTSWLRARSILYCTGWRRSRICHPSSSVHAQRFQSV